VKKPSRVNNNIKKIDPGKTQCQFWHCKKRAKERLGINYTEELNSQIVSCIKNNQKENPNFSVKYLESQSNRLNVYELNLKGKIINLVYDVFRHQVITFLFKEDFKNIYHYYDIFMNKVSTKHDFGKIWKLDGADLEIPGETIVYENNIWEVTDGVLKGKRFKLDHDEILETI
jgi:hypothetical protein